MAFYKGFQLSLAGYVTSDPELKSLTTGVWLLTWNMALNKSYKKDGQEVEKTLWLRCQVFSAPLADGKKSQAERLADLLMKGDLVTILCYDMDAYAWTPKEGGEPRAQVSLDVHDVKVLKHGAKSDAAPAEGDDEI